MIGHKPARASSVNEIAKCLHVKAPSITAGVDDLVEQGYVKRERSKTDRRVVELRLTTKGEIIMKKAHNKIVKELAKHLQGLKTEEAKTVQVAMRILQDALKSTD